MLIPLEVLNTIINDVEDKKDILKCRLVSSEFLSITTPHAFRVWNINGDDEQSNSAMTNLINVPELLAHVRMIVYKHNDADDEGMITMAASSLSHLGKFPNLKTMHFYFPTTYQDGWDEDEMSINRRTQISIFESIAKNPPPKSLRELEIHSLIALTNPALRLPGLADFLKPLTKLFIKTNSDPSDEETAFDIVPFQEFWDTDIACLCKPLASLTSLTLDSDRHCIALASTWDQVTYPNLTFLHLKRIIFSQFLFHDQIPGVVNFISRHGPTLVTLKLSSCVLDVEDELPRANAMKWSDIWAQFEQTLTHLNTFIFLPMPGLLVGRASRTGKRTFTGYVYHVIEGGWVSLFLNPPQDADIDRRAFEHLQDVIRARQDI
ncbi:hypothetical protein B0H34DRAFT_801072 [Crassisporium funariophilum]|nr:hypothetical protein B0H34DRAFT_801072 [Crassisporium funariophilum]